jgi:hypothetical protein
MMTDADFERMTDDEFDKWKSDPTKSLDEVEAFFLYLGRKYGKADVLYNKKTREFYHVDHAAKDLLKRAKRDQGLLIVAA